MNPFRPGLAASTAALIALFLGPLVAPPAQAQAATCTPGPGAACAGADLHDMDLSGRDLSGADLRGAMLDGANLSRTNLAGADLSGAWLRSAVVERANLERADLTEVHMYGSQFDFSDFAGADLDGVHAESADFAMTWLTDASARSSHFQNSNFYGAIVHRTDFTDADVRQASFHGADFAGTQFARARITGTVVTTSNIANHPSVRDAFFDRVHTHVNAYGKVYASCGKDRSDQENTCSGWNDDNNATAGLTHAVSFHWGRVDGDSRPFWIKSTDYTGEAKLWLRGVANPGLGAFDVRSVSGNLAGSGSHTPDHANRGQVGGPLALNVSFKDNEGNGTTGGYAMTAIGWLQHDGTARP